MSSHDQFVPESLDQVSFYPEANIITKKILKTNLSEHSIALPVVAKSSRMYAVMDLNSSSWLPQNFIKSGIIELRRVKTNHTVDKLEMMPNRAVNEKPALFTEGKTF